MRDAIVPLGSIALILLLVFYAPCGWNLINDDAAEYLPAAPGQHPSPVPVVIKPETQKGNTWNFIPSFQPQSRFAHDPKFEAQASQDQRHLHELEQITSMTEPSSRKAAGSVALIVGEYIWTDAAHRPLRYKSFDSSGAPLRDDKGSELVDFEGQEAIVVREFQATGFLISSRYILTSDLLLVPWYTDSLLDESETPLRFPFIQKLHAYFPGSKEAINLRIDHADESGSAVICILDQPMRQQAGLNIAGAGDLRPADPLVLLGYPGGVELLLSRVPDVRRNELYKSGRPGVDETAKWLAKNNLIQPMAILTRVGAQTEDRMFFETFTGFGSIGGPLVNSHGQVVAIHQAVHSGYASLNIAMPLAPIVPWVKGMVAN